MHGYRIQVSSDVDYKNLIAEVYVGDKYVALVSREDPARDYCVEFPGPDQHEPAISRQVDLSTLVAALAAAKAKLAGEEPHE
jgi:hypothetical protein